MVFRVGNLRFGSTPEKCHGTPVEKHCRQSHQHFTCAFFVQKCYAQLFSSYILAKKALSYEKRAHKMFMKFTPGLVRRSIIDNRLYISPNCKVDRNFNITLFALFQKSASFHSSQCYS